MPSIKINEIDNTIFQLTEDYNDNIVYIPGNAITGPSGIPTLCTTYDEFVEIFGDHAPLVDDDNIGSSWDFAANMLLVGFSVLFERVVPLDSDDDPLALKATANIMKSSSVIGKVTELYGGTFGNSLSYSISKGTRDIRFKLYKNIGSSSNVLLEDVKLLTITGMTDTEIKTALVAKIGSGYDTKYVRITVTDAANFDLSTVSNVTLSGGTDVPDIEVAKNIAGVYSKLSDTYLYDFKFVTSGNYYNMTIEESGVTDSINLTTPMKELAEARKDCVAIVNIPIGLDKSDVQSWVRSAVNSSYVACHAPWGLMNLSTNTTKWMSNSYIFLRTLARSVRSGEPIWRAPAGVNRARIADMVKPEYEIGEPTLDLWQNSNPPFINPFMYLLKYGYTIYGQRTTYIVDGSDSERSALQELGVRIAANEIKRKIRNICLGLTFEGNNLRTWNEFKGKLVPFLDTMKANGGLDNFKVVMDNTTTTADDINNNRIVGYVKVAITRAAEHFVIDFELAPAGATFDEEV